MQSGDRLLVPGLRAAIEDVHAVRALTQQRYLLPETTRVQAAPPSQAGFGLSGGWMEVPLLGVLTFHHDVVQERFGLNTKALDDLLSQRYPVG
ncbi:hypothetical protein CYMTET_36029 [Cymbomonas tetramitiformis]|uniref:Uncharacterized protein n=1 Tax=Cymbomonas tetramitiformis TaxID=36881 RepID=A0AAE0F818_9CHLO|nr:hypothetical protein CYMTET_36029 [Cymbomonas tetramitiformis]